MKLRSILFRRLDRLVLLLACSSADCATPSAERSEAPSRPRETDCAASRQLDSMQLDFRSPFGAQTEANATITTLEQRRGNVPLSLSLSTAAGQRAQRTVAMRCVCVRKSSQEWNEWNEFWLHSNGTMEFWMRMEQAAPEWNEFWLHSESALSPPPRNQMK